MALFNGVPSSQRSWRYGIGTQLILLHTVLNGISEEYEPYGNYARLHILVLKLFLHKRLHLWNLVRSHTLGCLARESFLYREGGSP